VCVTLQISARARIHTQIYVRHNVSSPVRSIIASLVNVRI